MENTICEILDKLSNFEEVKAIATGGSIANGTSDSKSDIDVYVFVTKDIPIEKRLELVKIYSSNYEVGGEYFGSGDEFWVDKINKQLDVMYWNINWFEDTIKNTWVKHYPSNGYSTCFLFTLNNFQIKYDSEGWLSDLQKCTFETYPQELKQNIIKRNLMLLKDKPFASYYEQISKAIARNDLVSINHRVAAFLASYFDIIFAVNELLHPGEKRLIPYAKANCKILPKNFEENIVNLLTEKDSEILNSLDKVIENLKNILH